MNTSALTYTAVTVKFSNIYEASRNDSAMEKSRNIEWKTEYRAPALKNATHEYSCCSILSADKLWDAWVCVQASQMDIIIINIITNINPRLKSFQTGNLQGSKLAAWALGLKTLTLFGVKFTAAFNSLLHLLGHFSLHPEIFSVFYEEVQTFYLANWNTETDFCLHLDFFLHTKRLSKNYVSMLNSAGTGHYLLSFILALDFNWTLRINIKEY